MNQQPLLILIFFAFLIQGFSQTNTQEVYGYIVDAESKEPLFGATVWVVDSDPVIGATTDFDGRYTLKDVPVGRVSIQFAYLGYEATTIPEILINSGKVMNLDVELKESLSALDEIVVQGKKENASMLKVDNEMATVSAMSFSIDQSTRYAGSNNDPSRLVLSLPGVRNQGDIQNGISIRGNSPNALLWTIEGMEVQSPNHFAREGALGAVNMMSGTVMQGVDFYTAAFPAQYSNAGSGVFDLSYRKGNPDKYEASIALGTLGVEGSIEGPISKKYKGSFLMGYRYSTLGILSQLGYSLGGNVGPVFQDFNYKLDLPTKNLGKFEIFGLVGDSYIRPIDIKGKFQYSWVDAYRLSMVGVKNSRRVSDKTFLQTSALYSQSKGQYVNYWNNLRYKTNEETGLEEFKGLTFVEENFPIQEKRAQIDLKTSTKHNAQHSFQTGINITYIDFFQSFDRERNFLKYKAKTGDLVYDRTLSDTAVADVQTFQIRAFFQHKYRLTDQLSFTAGLSFLHMNANKFFAVEPRVGMEYTYGKSHLFTMGFGMHSRLESIGFYATSSTYLSPQPSVKQAPVYDENFGSVNQFVQATRSLQGVVGNTFRLGASWTLKTEAYFQYLYNIPVEEFPTFFLAYAAVNYQYPSIYDYDFTKQAVYGNYGRGLNYGLDVSLEKSFTKQYYLMLNASLYESKFRTPYSLSLFDKRWLNTKYNGNFIVSMSGGKDFTVGKEHNNLVSLNFRSIWAGNNRVDDPVTFEPFATRLSNYFRLDTRLAYTRNKSKYAWTLSVDMQNVTNRINESSNPVINAAGVIPFLNYKVDL